MPCNNVTEQMQVLLDARDRVVSYHFNKKTCGQAVGAASLLLDWAKGRDVDSILSCTAEELLDDQPCSDELTEFLTLKHFFGLQMALGALTGVMAGHAQAECAVAEVVCEGDTLVIEADIAVDIVTEKIRGCGNCGSCGSKRKAKKATADKPAAC